MTRAELLQLMLDEELSRASQVVVDTIVDLNTVAEAPEVTSDVLENGVALEEAQMEAETQQPLETTAEEASESIGTETNTNAEQVVALTTRVNKLETQIVLLTQELARISNTINIVQEASAVSVPVVAESANLSAIMSNGLTNLGRRV